LSPHLAALNANHLLALLILLPLDVPLAPSFGLLLYGVILAYSLNRFDVFGVLMMRTVFKAQHPLFGRANNRQPLRKQQDSPYYWWWAFLRRNRRYLACCEGDGKGELEALYKDFGDVRDADFRLWWNAHGSALFSEQPPNYILKELTSKDDWAAEWTADTMLVVAVPLTIPKNQIGKFFNRLLKTRHKGQRGRKALSDGDASTARYPLNRNVNVAALKKQLAVYDAYLANETAERKQTLAQIGAALELVPHHMPNPKDSPTTAADKRRIVSATVSRYYKQASIIIEATADGVFPAKC